MGLGMLGVFVPLFPTTPFLLLAAYLYARSSDRLYRGLLSNRLVGDYLHCYDEGRCMTGRHKAVTLGFLWTILAATATLAVGSWWTRGLLGGVGIAVTVHILLLPRERGTAGQRKRSLHLRSAP